MDYDYDYDYYSAITITITIAITITIIIIIIIIIIIKTEHNFIEFYTRRSRVKFKNLKDITSDHIWRNTRSFIYNILNKIEKQKPRECNRCAFIDTQLCNGFQTADMFYFNQSRTTLWQVNQAWSLWSLWTDQVFKLRAWKN